MKPKRFIHVSASVRNFLCRAMNVTPQTVWRALTYQGGGDTAPRIRRLALERGGVAMMETREIETIHDVDGFMNQYFPGGIVLRFSKEDGSCSMEFEGKKVKSWQNVRIAEIEAIQREAMSFR